MTGRRDEITALKAAPSVGTVMVGFELHNVCSRTIAVQGVCIMSSLLNGEEFKKEVTMVTRLPGGAKSSSEVVLWWSSWLPSDICGISVEPRRPFYFTPEVEWRKIRRPISEVCHLA